ncbi:hypothetical protein KC909_01285 [Candidatus Dojkabacteria bacterium]|uniref:Uncharacterized protein n=1 Tax=Candidatus Dojkabacteria bacterium TaxID=2099670 RepID=A0A955L4W7_9BACT|nr:hypothetical protein [Candidatus Dojkabacteria bacterium]
MSNKYPTGIAKIFPIIFMLLFISPFAMGIILWIYNYGPQNIIASYTDRFDISGEVIAVNSRYSNDSTSFEKISIRMIDENGENVFANCDDTRCINVLQGDQLTLNCYLQQHRQGPEELECRFVGVTN